MQPDPAILAGAPDLRAIPEEAVALVQGASRGIGLALVERLLESPRIARLYASCRSPAEADRLNELAYRDDRLSLLAIDIARESSIETGAAQLQSESNRLDLLINCAGTLHESPHLWPERQLREVDPDAVLWAFRVNALGALLVLKGFEPLLKKSPAARAATLSARVGSISDNRLGGWYGYRSSKAALNQMMRTLAIQWRRLTRPIMCVVLHPGTVATELSRPFIRGHDPDKIFAPARAASQLLDVLDGLVIEDTGGFFAWDGQPIPW